MANVCILLAPMRNGTSVLMYALSSHPEIFQMAGLIEQTAKKSTNWPQTEEYGGQRVQILVDMYIPLMEAIAGKDVSNDQTEGELARQHSLQNLVVIDRTHIPMDERFWRRLADTDFKVMSIFRHPAEVALSYLSWQEKHGVDPEALMQKWVSAVDAYHFLKDTNDTLLLKHEDICGDPESQGRRIFDWLGVSPNAKFASYYQKASQKRQKDSRWQTLITDEVTRAAESIGYAPLV